MITIIHRGKFASTDCDTDKQEFYAIGADKPNYPVPAIRKCYCGYSIEAHRDLIPCDYLGFLNYG